MNGIDTIGDERPDDVLIREVDPRIQVRTYPTRQELWFDGVKIFATDADWKRLVAERLDPIRGMKGSCLEIGYGLGYSSRLIDELGDFQSHIIIEKYPELAIEGCIIGDYKEILAGSKTKYDFIFYDPYPYAEDFIEEMRPYLKPGGLIISLLNNGPEAPHSYRKE